MSGAIGMAAWTSLAVAAGVTLAPGASPAGEPRVYSDFCTEAQSGDVAGHEIDLMGPPGASKLRFFWSEGAIMWPLYASKLARAGDRISFVVRGSEGVARFRGRIEPTRIVGQMRDFGQSAYERVSLPRRPVRIEPPAPCAR